MKARKVKGVDADGRADDQLARIATVRLDELYAFMPAAADPDQPEALHDLRIAAKRLRYLLEISAESFGPYAAKAAKRARDLQDAAGVVHDCDVLLPRVQALVDEFGGPGAAQAAGLDVLAQRLRARRAAAFEGFAELWTELQRKGFRARLEYALTERPAMTSRSHDGNPGTQDDLVPSDAATP